MTPRRPSSGRWTKIGIKRGVVIAMNPQTGEVLAMVSLPTYDNNLFARGISNADVPDAAREPGQAAAQPRDPGALPARLDLQARDRHRRPRRRQDQPRRPGRRPSGYLTLGDTKFYDWNRRGWGPCDIYCGFGHSSDTFFYQVAGMLGHRPARPTGPKQYGFGSPDRDRSAGRGVRHRPDERMEAGGARRRRSSRARPTRPGSARATTW